MYLKTAWSYKNNGFYESSQSSLGKKYVRMEIKQYNNCNVKLYIYKLPVKYGYNYFRKFRFNNYKRDSRKCKNEIYIHAHLA